MSDSLITLPQVLACYRETILEAMQGSGCVAIEAKRLESLCPDMSGSMESMKMQADQLDVWTAILRASGFPIDNDSVIASGMEASIIRALVRCGADWFVITYGNDGFNFYGWGSGGGRGSGIFTYDCRRAPASPRLAFRDDVRYDRIEDNRIYLK